MRVELLTHGNYSPRTGIGRYVHEISAQLSDHLDFNLCQPRYLPLSNMSSLLRQLPIAIEGHVPGSIVHFPQIMGCAMMLYHPYHPSVATVHDLGFLELPEELKMFDPIGRQLVRLSLIGLKRVDAIVADSEFTNKSVVKHLGISAERVVTVPLGVDRKTFHPIPDARAELLEHYPGLRPQAANPWLLYVGSELPRKNMRTLLRALALLRTEVPTVRLLKVGSSGGAPYRHATLSAIDQLALDEHVLFFDNVAETELPIFYSAADLFVTASKLEGFGFPVLEAIACGTPVICSSIPALKEFSASQMVNYTSHEPSEIALKAKQLLLEIRGSKARESGNASSHPQQYSWGKTAKRTLDVYSSLA